MVTQLQPDVRAYLHGGEVIKRYIRVEEVAHEYGLSVEETEYIAKAAGSLYKLTHIHLVKKERFDEFMKHIYKVPGTNKQIIKKAVGDHRGNASIKRNPHLFDRAQQRTHRHRKHLKRISKPYNAQIRNSNLLDFRFICVDAHDKFRCKKRKTGKQQPDAQHKQKRKPIRAGDPVIILRAPVLREKEHAASDKPPVAGKHQA